MNPLDLIYSGSQRNVWLDGFLRRTKVPLEIVCDVHRNDEMFSYTLGASQNSWNDALVLYHHSGLMGWRIVQQLLALCDEPERWLDFGCGYGRVLRFAVAEATELAITGVDIDARAVEFVRETFDVEAVVSSHRPDDFGVSEEHSLVTAQSVFSHLPRASFEGWLKTLWSRVAEGGILAVSTNDISGMPEGLGEAGLDFVFERHSESDDLLEDLYGTTWISEEWMRTAFRSVAGEDLAWMHRIPRGLWNAQDLWVAKKRLSAAGETGGPPSPTIERLPVGYLDGVELIGPNRINLAGWCLADATHEPVGGDGPGVVVEVLAADGTVIGSASADHLAAREDLVAEYGEGFVGGSWWLEIETAEPLAGTEFLCVLADDWPVHFSLLDAADRKLRTQRELHELEVALRIREKELEMRGGIALRFARAAARRLTVRRLAVRRDPKA